jgi:glycosyltransferase involved in cell wall biosynthesis
MSRPSLSVIMPNYNHGRFLRQSLAAIAEQSAPAAEILVVDDASTDDSLEILAELRARDRRIRVLRHEKNLGAIAALNRGLAEASGDCVYGASADDKVMPGFFEKSLDLLAAHPGAGLCSSRSYLVGEDLEPRGEVYCPLVSKTSAYLDAAEVRRKLKACGSWFLGNTTLYRRGALAAAGGYLPELASFCDGYASLSLALKHGACFIPEKLACWRRLPAGFSSGTASDPAQSLRIMEAAARLMRTRDRELFDEDFVRRWERDWFFNLLDDTLAAQRAALARLKAAVPAPTARDRVNLNLLLAQNAAQRLLARTFHAARLRRFLLRRLA